MKANVLKKIQYGNPLVNLGLRMEFIAYEATSTDEELAKFYHYMLTEYESRSMVTSFIWAMINQSTGVKPQIPLEL